MALTKIIRGTLPPAAFAVGAHVQVRDREGLIFRKDLGTVMPAVFDDDTHVRVRLDKVSNTVVGYKASDLLSMAALSESEGDEGA